MTDTPSGTVRARLEALNAGNVAAMSALFTPDRAILDGARPHLWRGPTAVAVCHSSDGWRVAAWAWSKGTPQR